MLRFIDRGLMVLSWVAAAVVVLLLFVGPSLIGAKKSTAAPSTSPRTSTSSGGGTSTSSGGGTSTSSASSTGEATRVAGARVFTTAGCASCHTLKAAGATGSVGPDLDQLRPSAADVIQIVKSGGGPMPSFSGKLSDAQITAVADYVSSVAGH